MGGCPGATNVVPSVDFFSYITHAFRTAPPICSPMFIRKKKMNNGTIKVQTAKSVREGDKVRQRIVRHVGTAHRESELGRYEVFPGNSHEGHTLLQAVDGLQERYPGVVFTIVADAAMINRDNERALQERGIPYVLGARIRTLPVELTERGTSRSMRVGRTPVGS